MKRTVEQSVFDSKSAKNIISAGHKQACDEMERTPRRMLDEGNPNNPIYDNKLLGYDEREFLAKQYR